MNRGSPIVRPVAATSGGHCPEGVHAMGLSVVDQVLAHLESKGVEKVTAGMAELHAYCKTRMGAMTAVEAFHMVRKLGGDAVLFREYRLAGATMPDGGVKWWAVLAPGEEPC